MAYPTWHHAAALSAYSTSFLIVIRARLNPVVHGDKRVIGITHDRHRMGGDGIDDVDRAWACTCSAGGKSCCRKTVPHRRIDGTCSGFVSRRVFADDPLQFVDPAQETLQPLVAHFGRRGDNDAASRALPGQPLRERLVPERSNHVRVLFREKRLDALHSIFRENPQLSPRVRAWIFHRPSCACSRRCTRPWLRLFGRRHWSI